MPKKRETAKAAEKPEVVRTDPERCIREVRYPFNAQELKILGEQLAAEVRAAIADETAKAAEVAKFTERRKDHDSRCASLSLKISQGYEYRETECVVQLSTPRPGVKTIVRADNGDWVAEEPMTHEEMQNRLFPVTEAGADAKVQ